MKKDELQLSEEVVQLAKRMAKRRKCTPNEMISRALEQAKDRLERWKKLQRQVAQYQKKNGIQPLTMDEIDEEVHAYRREQQGKAASSS